SMSIPKLLDCGVAVDLGVETGNNLDQSGWPWVGLRFRFVPDTPAKLLIWDSCTLHWEGCREPLDEWVSRWEGEKANSISGLVVVEVYGSWKETGFGVKNIGECCSEVSCDPAGSSTLDLL